MADQPPVRDIALDPATGLVQIVNGDLALVAGIDAVVQGSQIRLRTFLGEIYLDESQGVDYIGQILGVKNPDPAVVRELLREAIADTPDVTDAVGSQLSVDPATRRATIDYQVATVYSSVPVNNSVTIG